MFQDPSEPGIRDSIREIHFFLNGHIEGQEAKGKPEKWEGLDPTHLEALDCVLKYLDEWADIKTQIEKGKGDPKDVK